MGAVDRTFDDLWGADRLHASRWARVLAVVVMIGAAACALLPNVPVLYTRIFLFAGVLIGAACYGLAIGLSAATVGFALLLWREIQSAGNLVAAPVIAAVVWFAVAKFAAALIGFQRKQYQRQKDARCHAEAVVRQQTLLLHEMTHRTRNDMHRLHGMLNVQARDHPEASDVLGRAASHLLIQARLNERLAMRGAQKVIESQGFLDDLAGDIRGIIESDRNIGVVVSAENHPLAPAIAAHIGLIVNELVTNSLKHAFPATAVGIIRVIFRRVGDDNGLFELTVSDNGVGYEVSGHSKGHGHGLLHGLAAQLGGRMMIAGSEVGGTQCRLLFPAEAPPAPPGAFPSNSNVTSNRFNPAQPPVEKFG
ncbi:sensor histidine kinase [Rhodopila sp.]|uniref:sensor histidine kinase n=1 Tax=Rhodopila sp. TaxID=2480087 RepID=UPI003D14F6C3